MHRLILVPCTRTPYRRTRTGSGYVEAHLLFVYLCWRSYTTYSPIHVGDFATQVAEMIERFVRTEAGLGHLNPMVWRAAGLHVPIGFGT